MRLTQVFMGPKNKILKLLVVADDSVMQVPGFIHPQNIIWLQNLRFFSTSVWTIGSGSYMFKNTLSLSP